MLQAQASEVSLVEELKTEIEISKFGYLPTEILEVIFSFCDAESLCQLSRTCERFNNILCDDKNWKIQAASALITNLIAAPVRNRNLYAPLFRERCRISHNWKVGKYRENFIKFCSRHYKTRFMPWLVLEKDRLWWTEGNNIKVMTRGSTTLSCNKVTMCLEGGEEDFSRFIIRNGVVISGGRDGGLYGWTCDGHRDMFYLPNCHTSDINAVDMHEGLILTASRDCSVKMWRLENVAESQHPRPETVVFVDDRVWSVAIDPVGSTWACGSSGLNWTAPLHVYDFQGGEVLVGGEGPRVGAGILDLAWQTPHTLLTCGYDGSLKLWDLRTGDRVGCWEDPHDAVFYSLATDHQHSVMCGTGRYGRVQLWDLRQNLGVQMYFAKCRHSSPVYSLGFDANSLFVALDSSLHAFDFTARNPLPRNYAEQQIIIKPGPRLH